MNRVSIENSIEARLMGDLVEQTYRLYYAFRQADCLLHGTQETTEAERGPLFALFADGPMSVPALARARSVTRQRIQQIMNSLVEVGFVERRANPASEKSPLYGVSARGRKKVLAMLGKERKMFRDFSSVTTERKLRTTISVLHSVREEIERRL